MEHKTTWMRYLIIGINVVLTGLMIGCKTDYVVRSKWVYINETEYEISVIYHSSFSIEPNGQHVFEETGDGSKNVTADSYVPPNIDLIMYDSVKCEQLAAGNKAGQGEGPAGIQNYESKKLEERFYEFTYRFTTPCWCCFTNKRKNLTPARLFG